MSTQMLRLASATFRPRSSAARPVAAFARRVEVLHTLAQVEAIAADWRALEAVTPEATGFQSYDWCHAWMQADRHVDDRWRIVTLREGGRLVSLWPLERDRFLGARVLRWLGEPWTQYGDALVVHDNARLDHLASVWREIAAWTDIDLIKLGRVRDDAALRALPGLSGRTVSHREHAPFIDLARKALPPPPTKRLASRRRKLEKIGSVRFEVVTDPVERRSCVEQAIAWKSAWLETRSLASSGLFHASLHALMESLAGTKTLVIGRLRVGDDIAALELGLQANQRFRSLLGSHSARFAYGSPGHLLIGHMIEWCRGADFTAYDFMVPADPYKRQWSNDETVVSDHLVATRLRGRVAAGWYYFRPVLKRGYRRLPERIRYVATACVRGKL